MTSLAEHSSWPPCFFFASCRRHSELEKNGKSLCRKCAAQLTGREYPLRLPTRRPIYATRRDAAVALGLLPPRRLFGRRKA